MSAHEPVLLLTHSGDFYCIDLVEAAVKNRGFDALRINTDHFPVQIGLTTRFGQTEVDEAGWPLVVGGRSINLREVPAVWARRLWPGRMPDNMDPKWAAYSRREARTAFFDTLSLLEGSWSSTDRAGPRWVNAVQPMLRAESKLLQLHLAEKHGLSMPPTLVTNHPTEAREFWRAHEGKVITKLLGALSQTMDASGDFLYTSRVTEQDLDGLDSLVYCPQIFQREVDKAAELRCIVVGDQVFSGAVDASGSARARVDWRLLTKADGAAWSRTELDEPTQAKLLALVRELGLVYGAADFIRTPEGEHVFLEVNPAGEWGWLQRDLELPIAEAIADELVRDL